ncbi:MAG: FAD-binding oxidoreductase [Gemmatimonadales bacterium]
MQTPRGFKGVFRTDDAARALYSEGAGIFRILPEAVTAPESVADLQTLIRWAGTTGTALVPRGAGSGMPGGNVGPGVVVDLTRGFKDAPAVNAEARTARAGAGTTYRQLNAAAAVHGLVLPPDPSSGAFCTIGGMAATNAAGAHSVKYGPIRDWIDAVEFVTADGELARAGKDDLTARTARTDAERRLLGDAAPFLRLHQRPLEEAPPHTRKNSSGYRLAGNTDNGWVRHLLIGSEGTLGIITAVEVRLAPRPARSATILATLASLDDLTGAVEALLPLGPTAVELLDRTYLDFVRAIGSNVPGGTEAVLLIELETDSSAGAEALRGIAASVVPADDEAAARKLWDLRHLASPILARLSDTTRSLQVVEDGCVPLAKLGEYVAGLRRIAKDCDFEIVIFGHAGDAHVHANVLADTGRTDLAARLTRCLADATQLQLELGGTPSGEHGDGRLRAPFLARLYGATYFEACHLVKNAMDPRGILNPGVKLPLPGTAPALAANALKVGASAPPIAPEVARMLRDIERDARYGEDRLGLLPAPGVSPV